MKTLPQVAAALAAASLIGGNANALVLDQGATAAAAPSTGAMGNLGTLLQFVSKDIATASFAGEARAAVYDGPEAGVNLDFYYQFTNHGGSNDAIARIAAGGFGDTSVNVFQSAGPWGGFVEGTAPAGTVEMSNDGTIAFNFGSGIASGLTSWIMQVRTGATSFVAGSMGIIDGTATVAPAFTPVFGGSLPGSGGTGGGSTDGGTGGSTGGGIGGGTGGGIGGGLPPVEQIPEPETYALMLAGLGLLGIVARRRSRRNDGNHPLPTGIAV